MTDFGLAPLRLRNQRLLTTTFRNPVEVVRWLGAVQSQEYAFAKWALGLRMVEATDSPIEQAFNAGAILRTHVMRPTWHFVTPEDIRWLLALTRSRVHAINRRAYPELGLDGPLLRRCADLIADAVRGGNALTRDEIGALLTAAGIPAEGRRLAYIMSYVELEAVVCSGPRRGKQFTYALLDERAPHGPVLAQDEALAELVRRYFTSHGPATIKDFVWWSGLTVADTKAGLAALGPALCQEEFQGQTYWFAPSDEPVPDLAPLTAHLLPPFDEYTNYESWRGIIDPAYDRRTERPVFSGVIAIAGQMCGHWRRTLRRGEVLVELAPYTPLTDAEREAVEVAAQRLGAFLELPVVVA